MAYALKGTQSGEFLQHEQHASEFRLLEVLHSLDQMTNFLPQSFADTMRKIEIPFQSRVLTARTKLHFCLQ